jgi:hypothetical protein
MQEKILHQGLSARTTLIIPIIDYREVILGHEVFNGIIHSLSVHPALYHC